MNQIYIAALIKKLLTSRTVNHQPQKKINKGREVT